MRADQRATYASVILTAALLFTLGCGSSRTAMVPTPPESSCSSALCFTNSSTPATNPWPQSIAVADFNGDGKLDLLIPVYSIFTPLSSANILLGNGDGTFHEGPAFSLIGQNVNNIAVGDFNGDGKLDLALSLPDADEVQVMLGGGDGSFALALPISAPAVYAVATADLNGDGKLDLVAVNPETDSLTILLGNGDGTFTSRTTLIVPGGPQAFVIGDFNRDGKPDLAVASYNTQTVFVFLGNGDGTFTPVGSSAATGYQPVAIASGDFNGDGIPDLVVTNLNGGAPGLGTINILLGKGDGTFAPTTASPVPGSNPASVSVVDFNGDGEADLVVANAGSNTISVFLGNGDGTFASPLTPSAGTDPLFAAIGDFNGDGVPDLAAANNSASSVTVLLTQRGGTSAADQPRP